MKVEIVMKAVFKLIVSVLILGDFTWFLMALPLRVECGGKIGQLHRPKSKLRKLLENNLIVDKETLKQGENGEHENIIPTSNKCRFTLKPNTVENRFPETILEAVCDYCDIRCHPVTITRMIFERRCDENLMTIYKMRTVKVTVGYVYVSE